MSEELVPFWAQTIITDLAVIKTSLPNHIASTDRSIDDHEARIRAQEQATASIAQSLDRIIKLEENEVEIFNRLRKLEMRLWMAMGGITVVVTGIEIYSNLVANGVIKK
jgi:hypothetical protein